MSPAKKEIGYYTGIMLVKKDQKSQLHQVLTHENRNFQHAFGLTQRIHFARFIFFNDRQLACFIDYDSKGDLDPILSLLAEAGGSAFDKIFTFIEDAPSAPVNSNVADFTKYLKSIVVQVGLTGYAYQHTVREIWDAWEIKKQPSEFKTFQTGLNSIMHPISGLTYFLVRLTMKVMHKQMIAALCSVGTVHGVRFFTINDKGRGSRRAFHSDTKLCLFTSYDFEFEPYVMDFVIGVGDLFNLLMLWVENKMPRYGVRERSNVQKDADDFVQFVFETGPKSNDIFYYSAYPFISVQQIWSRFGKPENEKIGILEKLVAKVLVIIGGALPYWQKKLNNMFIKLRKWFFGGR